MLAPHPILIGSLLIYVIIPVSFHTLRNVPLSDNLPSSLYDLDYIPLRDEDNDNPPPSFHNLDSIPQCDIDEETSGWNPSLNVSQFAYREQCALRDSIASALWADRGNRRA
ncbi:poly(ADP-ribose) glycohydrolase ARH3 [Striga asiatica]|uniref:Poly(ADP-ribose) glycohydrolase ARH3 n=1 Tax=Striga asiatica TaxID=4170 RepID=A0A5A7R901_STRAF|nr:poly(ADP-ribose) glycohydrolase ARH3 [Striga asiatica]